MGNISLDELAALRLVLEYVPVKDVLTAAMNHMAECEDVKSQDSADTICKALHTFLK